MAVRPVFQKQGPKENCTLGGKKLGWASCTAYAMAMGIDVATGGAKRPSGCKVRSLTGDTEAGLKLSQVAAAAAHFGVPVSIRTGRNTVTPVEAARLVRSGRGFVLQGNTEALLHTRHRSTAGPANHAIWVNEVRGGTVDVPEEALVYDPAADHRRPAEIDQGPSWWPWSRVRAFAAALRPNSSNGPVLGPGRFYAGFIPGPAIQPAQPPSQPVAVVLRFGAGRTDPFPDHVEADPPAGRRVNVRTHPDRLVKGDIVDLLPAGSQFVACQRTTGVAPPGSNSRVWYGNRRGTEWIHETGLRRLGGSMAGAADDRLSTEDPSDTDVDDPVDGASDLPDDVPEDDLAPGEPVTIDASVPDTDPDAAVEGTPAGSEIDAAGPDDDVEIP